MSGEGTACNCWGSCCQSAAGPHAAAENSCSASPAVCPSPLYPSLCRTSVVGSVTWGSAMPGLSLVASAAGAALLNMPMQPWVTLDIAGLLPGRGAERVGGLCSCTSDAE